MMGCGLCPCAALNDIRLSVSLVNQGQGTTSCIIQLPKFAIQHVINFLISLAYDQISPNSLSGARS